MAHADANLTMETNMGDIGEALQRAFCAGESLSVPRQATAPRQILMGASRLFAKCLCLLMYSIIAVFACSFRTRHQRHCTSLPHPSRHPR